MRAPPRTGIVGRHAKPNQEENLGHQTHRRAHPQPAGGARAHAAPAGAARGRGRQGRVEVGARGRLPRRVAFARARRRAGHHRRGAFGRQPLPRRAPRRHYEAHGIPRLPFLREHHHHHGGRRRLLLRQEARAAARASRRRCARRAGGGRRGRLVPHVRPSHGEGPQPGLRRRRGLRPPGRGEAVPRAGRRGAPAAPARRHALHLVHRARPHAASRRAPSPLGASGSARGRRRAGRAPVRPAAGRPRPPARAPGRPPARWRRGRCRRSRRASPRASRRRAGRWPPASPAS